MICEKTVKRFCCEDISLIENYDKAISDNTQTWHCHHRLEIQENKILLKEELIKQNLYYNRPAKELIFLTESEHKILHGYNITEEKRNKIIETSSQRWKNKEYKTAVSKLISERTKGIHKTEQAKKNISIAMNNSTKFKEVMSSKEHREKQSKAIRSSKAHYDSHHSPEFIAKMKEIASHRSKKQIEQSKKFGQCLKGMKRYTTPNGKHTYSLPSTAPKDWVLGWK